MDFYSLALDARFNILNNDISELCAVKKPVELEYASLHMLQKISKKVETVEENLTKKIIAPILNTNATQEANQTKQFLAEKHKASSPADQTLIIGFILNKITAFASANKTLHAERLIDFYHDLKKITSPTVMPTVKHWHQNVLAQVCEHDSLLGVKLMY
jgi:hypothetical protein